MNKEIKTIIAHLEEVHNGEPWFGRSVYELLEEIDPAAVYSRPDKSPHSMADILYHMITWAGFAQKRIEKNRTEDLRHAENLDWRVIDPSIHTWKKGIQELKKINKTIISLLKKKDDRFLEEKVDYREYNFRYLLQGVIEHTIYHIGQIAYLHKMQG